MKNFILINSKTILITFILMCLTLSCTKQSSDALTEEDAKIILEQYMQTINGADLEMIDQIIDPDFELHSPFFPEPLKGIDNYKAFVTNTANTFSEFKATIIEVVVKGDKVWGSFTMEGVNTGPLGNLPATGKKFRITGLAITQIANGKVIKDETFWNVLDFYQQLGFTLVPPESNASE